MIKKRTFIKVVLIWPLLYLSSCGDGTLSADEVIEKYRLESFKGCDFEYRPLKTDMNIDGELYVNKATDTCFLILKNQKNDTLLKSIQKGIGNICFSRFIRIGNDFLMVKRDYGKTIYNKYNSLISNYSSQKAYSLDNYYWINTTKKSLIPIDRPTNDSLLKMIKNRFRLAGHCELLYGPFNESVEIAKDTIDGFQIYYSVKTSFELQKKGRGFRLKPSFSKIERIGLFKDNIGNWIHPLGNRVFAKINYTFEDPSKFYGERCQTTSMDILVSVNDDTNRLIRSFNKDEMPSLDAEMEKEHNVATISEFRPDMFKYRNGEYYISLFLPYADEYMESTPPLYHLDTLKWKMTLVPPYDGKKDGKYMRFSKKYGVLLSGDVKKRVSSFLDKYDIVEVSNGYRLKLKK